MSKKVAIVGFSNTTKDIAPFDDGEFEIWGCNHIYQFVPHVDVLFELHPLRELEAKYGSRWPDYRQYLEDLPHTVWMREHHPEFPTSKALPIDKLCEHFSFLKETVNEDGSRVLEPTYTFKSTISYMVAMAILEGASTIAIYGVDMVLESEWGYQRHNLYYFMGWARGLGIDLIIPEKSALMKEGSLKLYGYESRVEKYAELIKELGTSVTKMDREIARRERRVTDLMSASDRYEAVIEELDRLGGDPELNGAGAVIQERRKRYEEELEKLKNMTARERDELNNIGGRRDVSFQLMERMGYHNRGELG